jgi:hypothetical protein
MKAIALALAALLGATFAAQSAFAHRSGHHRHHGTHHGFALGLIIGAPLGYSYGRHAYEPYGYAYRYYVPQAPESVTAAPPHYAGPPVESRALLPNYSYFCDRTNAYYPDVTECSGGWTTFAPEPLRY